MVSPLAASRFAERHLSRVVGSLVGQDGGLRATPKLGPYLVRSIVGTAWWARMRTAGSLCSFMMTLQSPAAATLPVRQDRRLARLTELEAEAVQDQVAQDREHDRR